MQGTAQSQGLLAYCSRGVAATAARCSEDRISVAASNFFHRRVGSRPNPSRASSLARLCQLLLAARAFFATLDPKVEDHQRKHKQDCLNSTRHSISHAPSLITHHSSHFPSSSSLSKYLQLIPSVSRSFSTEAALFRSADPSKQLPSRLSLPHPDHLATTTPP